MDPGASAVLELEQVWAFAAKLANPDKEVLCYYGDGSFWERRPLILKQLIGLDAIYS
ncbi:MAG: hypothetical protein CM15mP73_0930 [Hyphomicrobiales bacterium]|nr:MAG: hypothetical protein CM15mP73_0930 [Hyphomicrobiales bacterium]